MGLRVHGLTFMLLTLPGVPFVYYGDEIGMFDHRDISWDDTTDPWACNTNDPTDFRDLSRDPARTPFQWDGTVNSGFNAGAKTWIPMHPLTWNHLAQQQQTAGKSFYKVYQKLLKLHKNETILTGRFESKALSTNVFGYTRSLHDEIYIVLINLSNKDEAVNVKELTVDAGEKLEVLVSSLFSSHKDG